MRRIVTRSLAALLTLLLAVPLASAAAAVRPAVLPGLPQLPAPSEEEENKSRHEAGTGTAVASGHRPKPPRRYHSPRAQESSVLPGARCRSEDPSATTRAHPFSQRLAMLQFPFPPPPLS